MNSPQNPVWTQAYSAAGLIAFVKAVLVLLVAFHVLTFDDKQNSAVNTVIETGVPIAAIFIGAWWASRKVTPLSAPRDVDGVKLTRPDNSPAIPELQKVHEEAIKINEAIDSQNDRGIKR